MVLDQFKIKYSLPNLFTIVSELHLLFQSLTKGLFYRTAAMGEKKQRTEAGSNALIPPSINDLFMRTQPIRREGKTKSILDLGME